MNHNSDQKLLEKKGTVSLSPSTPNTGLDGNVTYVQQFWVNLLQTASPHLSDNQIKISLTRFFNLEG